MPTYEFQCSACSQTFQKVLPLGSKDLPLCPACGGVTRKLIKPPMIHFKGSGFYKTDSAQKKEALQAKPQSGAEIKKPDTVKKPSASPPPA
ncbi:MAG: FmdB family zinc ribbon protein [Candidatus Peribacteraceae bacterium]